MTLRISHETPPYECVSLRKNVKLSKILALHNGLSKLGVYQCKIYLIN